MGFDKVLKEINDFGKYQKIQWFLLFLTTVPQAWYTYAPAFTAMKVDKSNVACARANWTEGACGKMNGTKCPSRIYSLKYTTIVADFDMFCDDHIKISMTKSVFYAGKLVGAYSFGWISDRWGRLATFFISAAVMFVCSLITTFSVDYYMFTALRFPIGVCSGGNFIAAFVLATEMVGPKWRCLANAFIQSGYGVGIALQALLAYLIPKWEYFNLAVTLPNLLFIAYYWLTPESPRWLLAKGKEDKARNIVEKFAAKNGKPFPDKTWDAEKEDLTKATEVQTEKAYNFLDLFRTKYLIKVTLIEGYSWFVTSMVFYGLGFNSGNLSSNKYLSFAATGLVEIPAYFFAAYLVDRVGRRLPLCLYYLIGGIALLAILPIQLTGNTKKLSELVLALVLIGKFTISASYYQVYIHTAEVYPTVIRTVGVGTASLCARIGGILAPIITDSAPVIFPYLIFGGTAFVASGLAIMLPETLGEPLPQNYHEEVGKSSKKSEVQLEPLKSESI